MTEQIKSIPMALIIHLWGLPHITSSAMGGGGVHEKVTLNDMGGGGFTEK